MIEPDEYFPELICDICGGDPEGSCVCPECPVCGTAGDPACIDNHMPRGFWPRIVELAASPELLLEQLRQDLAAATTENADLLSRLQTCQELSGGVLPMSDNAVKAGRFLLGILLTLCVSSSMGRRHSVHLNLSTEEAAALADALSPLFGDAGAAIKEK